MKYDDYIKQAAAKKPDSTEPPTAASITGPGAALYTGTTPPSVTEDGAAWLNTSTTEGKLYAFYDGQWVGIQS